jgi:hypothetical protein
MYQLAQKVGIRDLVRRQMPAMAASFVIAELFYKFQSFTLECGAFLATWFALDAIIQVVCSLLPAANSPTSVPAP